MPPNPGSLAPSPPPPQDGHLGWGAREGVLGVLGSPGPNTGTPPIPSHPIHLSPNWPPPRLALGKTFRTTTPHPLAWAKAIILGWASTSPAPSLALLALSWYPRPGQPPPTSPETGLSSQTSPRGLANPVNRKEKDPSPSTPLPLSRGIQVPLVRPSVPRAPSTGWLPGTKAWAALREGRRGWVVQLGYPEASQPGTLGCG